MDTDVFNIGSDSVACYCTIQEETDIEFECDH